MDTRRLILPAIPLALAAPAAQAQILYTEVSDLTVANGPLYFDLDHSGPGAGTHGFAGTYALSGSDVMIRFYGGAHQSMLEGFGASLNDAGVTNRVLNLSRDAEISTSSAYWQRLGWGSYLDYSGNPHWAPDTTGYIGLRLDAGSGDYLYGWARLTLTDDFFTLHDFAVNLTPNASILAGDTGIAIPEPSTTAALAGLLAGSAALYARRRKAPSA